MATTVSLPRPLRFLRPAVNKPLGALEDLGEQLSFYGRALGWSWRALISYKKEVARLIAEVSLGSGALAIIGGGGGGLMFITFFTRTPGGLAGYQGPHPNGLPPVFGLLPAP